MTATKASARSRDRRLIEAIDAASEELMHKLLLQDMEELKLSLKGKQRQGENTDFEVALSLYHDGIRAAGDRRMAASMVDAVHSDASIIKAHHDLEQQAKADRAIALRMSKDPSADVKAAARKLEPPLPEATIDEHVLRKLEKLNILTEPPTVAESSSWAASRDPSRGPDGEPIGVQTCISCTDTVPTSSMVKTGCSHWYCSACVNTLYKGCLTDESLFPPRCCKVPFKLDDVLDMLDIKTVGQFKAKEIEYGTTDRTYCHEPQCSNFVPPQFVRGTRAICVKCRSRTCTLCKKQDHPGQPCPPDQSTVKLKELAQQQGWQQCQNCKRMLELTMGCYHMSRL
jgi:hypothetical protein